MENPWHRLPPGPDYVLQEDEADVRVFNAKRDPDHPHFLHINQLIPEPFIGVPDAPVLLLSNNPGFGRGADQRQSPAMRRRMRRNLLHEEADYPFYYLDPRFEGPNRQW